MKFETLEAQAASYLEHLLLDTPVSELNQKYQTMCRMFGWHETDNMLERIRTELRQVLISHMS